MSISAFDVDAKNNVDVNIELYDSADVNVKVEAWILYCSGAISHCAHSPKLIFCSSCHVPHRYISHQQYTSHKDLA